MFENNVENLQNAQPKHGCLQGIVDSRQGFHLTTVILSEEKHSGLRLLAIQSIFYILKHAECYSCLTSVRIKSPGSVYIYAGIVDQPNSCGAEPTQ